MVENYLQNRKQAFAIKGKTSEYKTILCGFHRDLFVNDASVSFALKHPDRQTAVLNSGLKTFCSSAKQWKVSFNEKRLNC